jgi:peptidoglycan/xylan/chitin deacetylase (PgdA/CDA1 family)
MINMRRFFARSISEMFSGVTRFSSPVEGFRVLMYHAIGAPAFGDSLGIFSVTSKNFRYQMAELANYKRAELTAFSEPLNLHAGNRIAVTFDDGYLDNFEVAGPIMAELNIPFTVFVVSEFVRNRKPGFLCKSSLRELASLPGAQIGAHGANHVPLTNCDHKILKNELLSSKHFLEDVLGKEVYTISYPYGAVDIRVRDAALAAGYRLGASSVAGVNKIGRDPMIFSRTEILSYDNKRVFSQKLKGNWDWYRWRTGDVCV